MQQHNQGRVGHVSVCAWGMTLWCWHICSSSVLIAAVCCHTCAVLASQQLSSAQRMSSLLLTPQTAAVGSCAQVPAPGNSHMQDKHMLLAPLVSAHRLLDAGISTPGRQQLAQTFKLCDASKLDNKAAVQALLQDMLYTFQGFAQVQFDFQIRLRQLL